jgi:flagellar motor switch protein FliG
MGVAGTRLTGPQKAAILLISLGADLSSRVLKHGFYDEEIERISYEISTMERIPQTLRDQVMDEFKELKQARDYLIQGGIKYAKEVLEKTYGASRAAEMVSKLTGQIRNIPFNALRKTDPRHLSNFLREENPQTIALVLAHLHLEQASMVLSALPQELQSEVARRLAIMERTSPEITQEVERVLEMKLASVIQQEHTSVGGIKALVDILNMVSRGTEKNILEELENDDPLLAEEVRRRMFLFEDIVKLDDLSVQRILREVDPKDLALAMRGANEDVRSCVYKNQSKRASDLLKEEIEFMGPVRLKDVEEAQMKVVKVIRRLEEDGEIIISRGGEDALIV